MKAFEYVDVKSLDAAVKAIPADADASEYNRKVFVKAGGIDLLDQMKERMLEPEKLVNLKSLEKDLRYIKVDGDMIKIGPLTPMAEVAKSAVVLEHFPALAEAAGSAATPQIRNIATIGGNLCQRPRCWYFRNSEFLCLKKGGDICFAKEGENQYHAVFGKGPSYIVHPSNVGPALLAVDAELAVKGAKGDRTIKMSEFFVMPEDNVMVENVLNADEIITEIRVPANLKRSAHYEVREKASYDWPLVAVSAAQTPEGWKVVMGAVAPIPWRAKQTETVLGNKAMTAELASEAAEAAIAGASPLRYNRYKLDLIKVAVRRTLMKAAGMEVPA
jgi:xanthine dehydrogenase YagS FAD-binding subunit